jgi:peptide chain release factor 3
MQEGVVQVIYIGTGHVKTPLLAAVGPLQFEVVQYRLQAEYQAESHLESSRWTLIRWWRKPGVDEEWLPETVMDSTFGVDRDDRPVVLFADEWALRNFTQRNPGVELSALPFVGEKK